MCIYNSTSDMAPLKTRKYSNENVRLALSAVLDGMSVRKAAIKYGIPTSTLQDKLNFKYQPGKGPGRNPILTEEEEKSLVRCDEMEDYELP